MPPGPRNCSGRLGRSATVILRVSLQASWGTWQEAKGRVSSVALGCAHRGPQAALDSPAPRLASSRPQPGCSVAPESSGFPAPGAVLCSPAPLSLSSGSRGPPPSRDPSSLPPRSLPKCPCTCHWVCPPYRSQLGRSGWGACLQHLGVPDNQHCPFRAAEELQRPRGIPRMGCRRHLQFSGAEVVFQVLASQVDPGSDSRAAGDGEVMTPGFTWPQGSDDSPRARPAISGDTVTAVSSGGIQQLR